MAIFIYEVRTKAGDLTSGRVEAVNKRGAADILQRQGFIVVGIEESKDVPIYARRLKFLERTKAKDIVILSRQLATLFAADIPLVTALRTVGKQTDNMPLREKVFEISADVEGGSSLSDAISGHPDVFSEFYVNMIRAGEASGKLDEILSYLADHMEREYEVMSKVKGALIYPAFVVTGFVISMTILMVFVIPRLTSILQESGEKLPVITSIIIASSDFMRSSWYILLFIAIGAGIFFWRYIKTENGKKFWDRIQLKIPIFGEILKKVYLFRFAESLSTLIEGGLPITRAIAISRDITGNTVYKEILYEVEETVKRGGTIGETLVLYSEVPPLVTQMVVVGEQAGKLVSVLHNVASFYKKEVDTATNNITSLIEPILIAVMGVGVGLLVAGVLLPIYNMVGTF
ncbi:MAG: type II secretion system F family protein [Candidatus Spechtbacterales bacterium]